MMPGMQEFDYYMCIGPLFLISIKVIDINISANVLGLTQTIRIKNMSKHS